MSKTIEGVPESITREDYVRLIESVGLDPRRILELQFAHAGIYAEVFAVENGARVLDPQVSDYVKHHIFIPVVDD